MIFINFKSYPESSGDNAVKLAIVCESVFEETKIPVIPVVQALDAWRVTQHVHIPVWIQHIDSIGQGQTTGSTTIQSARTAGVVGTLLNHSEHPIPFDEQKKTVECIRNITSDFKILICVPNLEKLTNTKNLYPDYIAYEPPELIASKTASVASAHADTIEKGVKNASPLPLIVGAGIKSAEDVIISIQKGAKGILVASAVTLSPDPHEILTQLASHFRTS